MVCSFVVFLAQFNLVDRGCHVSVRWLIICCLTPNGRIIQTVVYTVISFVTEGPLCGEKVMTFMTICCNGTLHDRHHFANCCGNQVYYNKTHMKCVDGQLIDHFK